ncbi:MAG TPA: hypothetical protein EYM48_07520 [Campylobacterales bacterium]|nr:hypothetical protein [Campylobacterales bacterium]
MLYKSILMALLVALLSGCGASKLSVPSQVTEASIINSRQKAYVIFSSQELGGGRANPIFEYLPETEELKLVIIMGSHEKYIYPVDQGVHYFYSMGGETYDFLKVDALKGKKYYSLIDTVFWTFRMTAPIVSKPTTDVETIQELDTKLLIQNSPKSVAWYEKRKDNSDFKKAVKERFLEWKEDDMQDKTLHQEDGFDIK